MYKNFKLTGRNIQLVGYNYDVADADYVVVLIHGIGEHAGRYERMADYFKKEKIALVSMDLRGHGKSEGKRGHCAPRKEVLKDIDALIEYAQKEYPEKPIVLYGHSMGGNITLDYRARGGHNDVPVGYIISAPWIRLANPPSKVVLATARIFSKIAPKITTSSNCEEKDLGNLKYVQPYKKDPLVHPKVSMLCAYEGISIAEALETGKNEDNGRAKDIPTMIMHGTADKICSIEGSRNFMNLPKNRENDHLHLVEWEGYYHEIHNGGPKGETGEEVIRKAIDFIKSL